MIHGALARRAARRLLLSAPPPKGQARRVLMLIPSLAAGGAERQLALTARGLAARGWQVQVAVKHLGDPPGTDALLSELAHIPTAAIPAAALSPERGFPRHFRGLLARLLPLIRLHRPAVVHAWMDEMSAVGGLAAALAGVPRIVLAGRNLAPHRFGLPELGALRAVLRRLAEREGVTLLNNSRAGADDYARWLGLPAARIHVLRNGMVPLDRGDGSLWRARLGIPADAPVVGGLFRLDPEKRPLLWLDTAAALSRRFPTMHFVVFGDGRLRGALLDRAAALGLSGRLHLPGICLNRAEALAVLDVALLTSEVEGTPNMALECQWAGVPLVATAAGGMAEALCDGATVAAAPEALAEAVAARLGRPAPECRPWLERRFGLDRMLDETEQVYA